MKICSKCGVEKEKEEFYIRKRHNYIEPKCKQCTKINVKEWVSQNKERVKEKMRKYNLEQKKKYTAPSEEWLKNMEKICGGCKLKKAGTEFYKHTSHADGLTTECKKCVAIRHVKNKERINEVRRKRYNTNGEKIKIYNAKWRANNKPKKAEMDRNYRLKNAEYFTAKRKKEYKENPQKTRELLDNWMKNNPEANKLSKKRQRDKGKELLIGYYIKPMLKRDGFSKEFINANPDLIEAKKLIIKIKRHVEQKTNN